MNHSTDIYAGLDHQEFQHWKQVAQQVADKLHDTLLERDRANQHPFEEIDWLRQSGLLKIAVPKSLGGGGASLVQALEISRIIAAADGSIGQLIAYHYSNGVWSHILGTREQWEFIARGIVNDGWFQSSISNPRDPRLKLEWDGSDLYVSGRRTFATGAAISQVMTIAVWVEDKLVQYQITADRPGIIFNDDWDNLGQRLTASGTLEFNRLRLQEQDRLTGLEETPHSAHLRNALRNQFSQLIFVHFYLGIAEGALKHAAAYFRDSVRPWPESGVEQATDDPYHRLKAGELSAEIAAGVALAEKTTRAFEEAFHQSHDLTEQFWGELALLTNQAKAIADKVVLKVTHEIFELTGGRSTSNQYGLDIYWRNARTHTLHDPVAYRIREVGDYVLSGKLPTPRVYAPPKH